MSGADKDSRAYLNQLSGVSEVALEEALFADAPVLDPKYFVFALLTADSVRAALQLVKLPRADDLRAAFGLQPRTAAPVSAPIASDTTITQASQPRLSNTSQTVVDCFSSGVPYGNDTHEKAHLRLLQCLLLQDDESRRSVVAAGLQPNDLVQEIRSALSE